MEKRKDIDMLRFYEGDIRIRTSENRLLFKDFSKNSGNPQDKLWGDKEAYRTLNALLFDGYNNELERIQKDMHLLNPVFIELLEETLDIYKGVFSTMCGKKEIVASVSKVRRVDRRASLSEYEKGTTESFVSCSKGPYGTDFSKKNQVILLEIEIPENSPYVDYQQVLAEEYEKCLAGRPLWPVRAGARLYMAESILALPIRSRFGYSLTIQTRFCFVYQLSQRIMTCSLF